MVDEQWMRVPPSITLLGLNLIRPDPWTGTIFCPQLSTALKCLFFTFFLFTKYPGSFQIFKGWINS